MKIDTFGIRISHSRGRDVSFTTEEKKNNRRSSSQQKEMINIIPNWGRSIQTLGNF